MRRLSFMGLVVALITTILGVVGIQPANAATQVTSQSSASQADQTKPSALRVSVPNGTEVLEFKTDTAAKTARATAQAVDGTGYTKDCQSSVVDTPDGTVVKGCLYSETSVDATVKAHTRAKIEGKTQLSYVNPHAQPWSKVKAKRCQMIYIPKSWYSKGSPDQIRKRVRTFVKKHLSTVKGQKCVRLKHGSWWFNAGKEGKRKIPVLTMVQGHYSLFVQNSDTGVLEHKGELRLSGVFVIVCDNDWIWFAVYYIPYTDVIWVKSEDEVIENAEMESESAGAISLSGTKVCPAGTINWSLLLSTSTKGSAFAQLKMYVIAAMAGPGWAEAKAAAVADARGNAQAVSMGEIKIACGGGTQPPQYSAPTIDVSPMACVVNGGTTNASITVSNPNGIADTVKVTYRGQVYTKSIAAHGQVTFTFPNQGVGSWPGTALLVNADKSSSFTITAEACPVIPGTIDMMENVNDVVWGNTRTIRVTGTVPGGQTATLKSYADIGSIAPSDQSMTVTGDFDVLVHYTAPTEGSSDTVTVKLFSSGGVKWDEKSDSFALGRPATP